MRKAFTGMATFKAELAIIGINPFVYVPQTELQALFKAWGKDKGQIPVCGNVNGVPYEQTLVRYSGEWRLYINTTMLPGSPKRIGETIEVSIEFDPRDRTLHPHPDLIGALEQSKEANTVFQQLPPSRKKEIIRYISAVKTEGTRQKNIEKAIGFLLGKNPFAGRNPDGKL